MEQPKIVPNASVFRIQAPQPGEEVSYEAMTGTFMSGVRNLAIEVARSLGLPDLTGVIPTSHAITILRVYPSLQPDPETAFPGEPETIEIMLSVIFEVRSPAVMVPNMSRVVLPGVAG